MSDIPFLQRGIHATINRLANQYLGQGRRFTERSSLKLWIEESTYHDWFRPLLLRDTSALRNAAIEDHDGFAQATLFGVRVVKCEPHELENPNAAAHLTYTEPHYPAAVLTQSLDTWEFPALTPRQLYGALQMRGGALGIALPGRTPDERRPAVRAPSPDAPLSARASSAWFDEDEVIVPERQPLYHDSRPASASSGRAMKPAVEVDRLPTTNLKRKWGQ